MPLNKTVVSLLMLFLFISGETKSQLSGTKTIGSSGSDYASIKDAVDSLKSEGVDNSVVFKIESGIYFVDELTIDNISGVNKTKTIVFTSASGDSTDVVIKTNSADPNFLVKLNGCKRLTFKSITFESSEKSLPNQIILTEGARNNRFENCVFRAKEESFCESDDTIIVIHDKPSEQKQEFNHFANNKIIGGCIGISIEGRIGELEKGNQVIGNEFIKQNFKAVEVLHNDSGFFNHNTVIYEGDSTAVTFKVDGVYEIQGNSIFSGGNKALFIDTFKAKEPKLGDFEGLSVINNKISCPKGNAINGKEIEGLFLGHNTLFNRSDSLFTIYLDSIKYMVCAYNLLVNKSDNGVFNITTSAEINLNPYDMLEWQLGSNFNGASCGDSIFGKLNGHLYSSLDDWRDRCPYRPDPNSYFGNVNFDNDTTGLKLICGTSPSMRIKKESLLATIQLFLNALKNEGFFEDEDISGKDRDDSKFWIGHSDDGPPKIEIAGFITDSIDTINHGIVKLFAKRKNRDMLEEIRQMSIDPNGYYFFENLPSRDHYWLKIIPDRDSFPDYVPSYPTRHRRWDANGVIPDEVTKFCIDDVLNNIFPKKIDEFPTGDYSISGNISQTVQTIGLGKMLGMDPIPGLDVILDVTPPRPSKSVAMTQTDKDGNYTFSNLPPSDSGEIYTVTIDHYGLPADTLYEIKLEGNIVKLDYCVDTTLQIEGCAEAIAGMEDFKLNGVLLYPNPMGETLTISGAGEKFDLSIFNTQGKIIMNLVNQNEKALISTTDLQSGLYFVVIRTPDGESSYKVIK